MSASIITLLCLVEGESVKHSFHVDITYTDTVSKLKLLIREVPECKHLAADRL